MTDATAPTSLNWTGMGGAIAINETVYRIVGLVQAEACTMCGIYNGSMRVGSNGKGRRV